MLYSLTPQALAELKAQASAPCLSLFQPTHRSHPDNRQDPIRFRQGVEQLQASLRQASAGADVQALLAPFQALTDDADFWKHTLDDLAVLGCAGLFRVFVLPRPMPELALVADSFHLKPLRRVLQSVDRYQVLCLSRDKARLLEGNRDGLTEVELVAQVPSTSARALGEQLTEPHQTVSSHGGLGPGSAPLVHSSGGKKDEMDLDADRYFRALDRALAKHTSQPSGLPLMLAALPEHHHRFRQVNHNPLLLPDGLEINPDALDLQTLSQRAWAVVEPQHRARQLAWGAAFASARAHGLGSNDLDEVAKAAAEGRVASLLMEDGRQIAGRLDTDTGLVEAADLADPNVDDLLDDIGELVERMGAKCACCPRSACPPAPAWPPLSAIDATVAASTH